MDTIQINKETFRQTTSDLVLKNWSRPDESVADKLPRRVQAFYHKLNGEEFRNFTHPVSMAQIETALGFLDQNFSKWDEDETLADWEYVLPAIHKLFPEQRVFGYTADFSPAALTQSDFRLVLWLSISIGLALAGVCILSLYLIWKN